MIFQAHNPILHLSFISYFRITQRACLNDSWVNVKWLNTHTHRHTKNGQVQGLEGAKSRPWESLKNYCSKSLFKNVKKLWLLRVFGLSPHRVLTTLGSLMKWMAQTSSEESLKVRPKGLCFLISSWHHEAG